MTCPICERRENNRDYPCCASCEKSAHYTDRDDCKCEACAIGFEMPRTSAERIATINRLMNLAADDDGEVFEPMTADELAAMNKRIATSESVTW